jgi:hypothetical protein
MSAPLRILLSGAARDCLGPRIADALGPRPFELLSINALGTSPVADADIAFISRDVTGRSTKHELAPALQACYNTLRHAPSLRWVHIHSAGVRTGRCTATCKRAALPSPPRQVPTQ